MRYNAEFERWQRKFYGSKEWERLRNEVRARACMRCEMCGRLIRGRSIVDHITEITPANFEDEAVTLDVGNLQLLCLECHNVKHYGARLDYGMEKRSDVNLF